MNTSVAIANPLVRRDLSRLAHPCLAWSFCSFVTNCRD